MILKISRILAVLVLLGSGLSFAQGYVTPGLIPLPAGGSYRGVRSGYQDFTLSYFAPKAQAADVDVSGGIYRLSYEFHYGNTSRNDWMIGGSYTGGDIDIDPSKASFNGKYGIFGEWFFDEGMSLFAETQFGGYSENGPDYKLNDNSIGLRFKVEGDPTGGTLQGEGMAGIIYNFGEFDSLSGTVGFSGTEIVGFDVKNVSWLKWYYGEIDGKKLIITDFAFPFFEDPEYGMAYCLRYVMVNSHSPSAGTPHLLGYGSRLMDWTEHEEWWLQVSFGLGKTKSDWSGYIGYGVYRAAEIPGHNDTSLLALTVTYTY